MLEALEPFCTLYARCDPPPPLLWSTKRDCFHCSTQKLEFSTRKKNKKTKTSEYTCDIFTSLQKKDDHAFIHVLFWVPPPLSFVEIELKHAELENSYFRPPTSEIGVNRMQPKRAWFFFFSPLSFPPSLQLQLASL